jgi:hypothetical protein
MAMQMMASVPCDLIETQIRIMQKKIEEANAVNNFSSYQNLSYARITLSDARGTYRCLAAMELLPKADMVAASIDMVEQKIEWILKEKRGNDVLKRRS